MAEFNPNIERNEGNLLDVVRDFLNSRLDKQQTLKLVIALLVVCVIIFVLCIFNLRSMFI